MSLPVPMKQGCAPSFGSGGSSSMSNPRTAATRAGLQAGFGGPYRKLEYACPWSTSATPSSGAELCCKLPSDSGALHGLAGALLRSSRDADRRALSTARAASVEGTLSSYKSSSLAESLRTPSREDDEFANGLALLPTPARGVSQSASCPSWSCAYHTQRLHLELPSAIQNNGGDIWLQGPILTEPYPLLPLSRQLTLYI
jgi:hypothetical protein